MPCDHSESAAEKTGSTLDGSALLAQKIARWTQGHTRVETSVHGLVLHRWETPTELTSYMLAPSICLIGQGKKRLFLGKDIYVYDARRFLITSVDLPVVSQIIEASNERPYLGLTMELDLQVLGQLILANNLSARTGSENRLGIAVSKVSEPLYEAFNRLLTLLEHPDDLPALAPLIQQEISYRLLASEQGPRLQYMVSAGNHGYQIVRAVDWLKDNFRRPIKVDQLANMAGLSVSAFHNHFRSVTGMSPLQFQKTMRLNEARRLMLMQHLDASKAAFEVGYESPSQFSREYSRLFGKPPVQDIKNLTQDMPAFDTLPLGK